MSLDLANLNELTMQYGIARSRIVSLLADLEPVTYITAPRGKSALYDRTEAHKRIQTYLEKLHAIPKDEREPSLSDEIAALRKELSEQSLLLKEQSEKTNKTLAVLAKQLSAAAETQVDVSRTLNTLVELLLDQQTTKAAGAVETKPEKVAEELHFPVDAVVQVPVEKKLAKIVVIGLKATQANEIETEFGKTLDLKFFSSDQVKNSSIGSIPPNCDRTYVMTRFVSHNVEEHLKKAGQRATRIMGSTSSLKTELRTLISAKALMSNNVSH